jgi:hypothetical protein
VPEPTISYGPRPDATPTAELTTLANIYAFVLRCGNKNAPGVTSTKGDDERGRSRHDSLARSTIHE